MMTDADDPRPSGGNLTRRIVEGLGRAIVAGDYAGVPFPIEAEISAQFGASRSVTREAIKMLTAKGLVSSRARHGTSVAPEKNWNFLDPDVLRWLLARDVSFDLLAEFNAFRTAIEPMAARLAILRNDRTALAEVERAIEAMAAVEGDDAQTLQADIDFHVAILMASGNRFLIQCRDLVDTALRFSIRLTNKQKGVPFGDIDAHRAIAKAIASGDVDTAVNTTLDLLTEAGVLIERARAKASR